MRSHTIIPSVPRGYQLDPCGDWLSIIVPEATTNLFTNPSIRDGLTNCGQIGVGSTIARVFTYQRFGAASLQCTPGASTTAGTEMVVNLVAGTTYTMSVYVNDPSGRAMQLQFYDRVLGTAINTTTFRPQPGVWTRAWVSATPISTGSHGLRILKNGSTSTAVFYCDGYQCEAKAYPTTYCDGDQKGFVPTRADYYWTGAPHASTSVRIAQCRAGGKEMKLSLFGFRLLSIVGLGMAPTANVSLPGGFLGGATYQRTVYESRLFSLLGDMRSDTIGICQDQANLIDALKHDLTTPPQPLLLRYQRLHGADDSAVSEEAYIRCLHEPLGPGNTYDNLYQESTELRFRQDRLPTIESVGEVGASLTWEYNPAGGVADYLVMRTSAGVWQPVASGIPNGNVYIIRKNPITGLIFIGGAFTSFGGDGNKNRIFIYNPATGTASAIGVGANGDVYDIAFRANGDAIIVGNFTSIGGVACNRIAEYSTTGVVSAIGVGFDNIVRAVIIDARGNIIATGDFLNGGGIGINRLASINTSDTYATIGTGLGASGYALALDTDGSSFYVGGAFTNGGGVAECDYIAYIDGGTTFTGMSAGLTGTIRALLVDSGGTLYAGGTNAADCVRWNKVQFIDLGSGLASVQRYAINPIDNALYAVGAFRGTAVGPWSTDTGTTIARFASGEWHKTDIYLDGTSTEYALEFTPDGVIYLGGDHASVQASYPNNISNPGDAGAYPIFEFNGPGTIVALINHTTGKSIFFDQLVMTDDEKIFFDLNPSNIILRSNIRGDISRYVNRSSQIAEFFIQGRDLVNTTGSNIIGVLIDDSDDPIRTDSGTTAIIHFRPRYQSLQSLIYR